MILFCCTFSSLVATNFSMPLPYVELFYSFQLREETNLSFFNVNAWPDSFEICQKIDFLSLFQTFVVTSKLMSSTSMSMSMSTSMSSRFRRWWISFVELNRSSIMRNLLVIKMKRQRETEGSWVRAGVCVCEREREREKRERRSSL